MADSLTQADGATDYIAAERGHTDTWSEILVGHETSIAKSANRVIVIFFAIGNGRIITFTPPRSHVQKVAIWTQITCLICLTDSIALNGLLE